MLGAITPIARHQVYPPGNSGFSLFSGIAIFFGNADVPIYAIGVKDIIQSIEDWLILTGGRINDHVNFLIGYFHWSIFSLFELKSIVPSLTRLPHLLSVLFHHSGFHPAGPDSGYQGGVVALVLIGIGDTEISHGIFEGGTLAHIARQHDHIARARVGPRQRPAAQSGVAGQIGWFHHLHHRLDLGVAQLAKVEMTRPMLR